jgi:hypothetical protein
MAKRCWLSMLLGVLAVSALAGCQSAPPDYGAHEDQLAAAGFIMRPANTPQRQQMMSRLPAHRFVIRQNGDTVHYVYADPLVCDCLYVGTQQAYNQFEANQLANHLASERQLAAITFADSAWSWDAWGPWGAAVPFGFVYESSGW